MNKNGGFGYPAAMPVSRRAETTDSRGHENNTGSRFHLLPGCSRTAATEVLIAIRGTVTTSLRHMRQKCLECIRHECIHQQVLNLVSLEHCQFVWEV